MYKNKNKSIFPYIATGHNATTEIISISYLSISLFLYIIAAIIEPVKMYRIIDPIMIIAFIIRTANLQLSHWHRGPLYSPASALSA